MGKDEELTSILSINPFLVNWINKEAKTPLRFAIEENRISTCELLLDLGADMFLKTRFLVKNFFNLHITKYFVSFV